MTMPIQADETAALLIRARGFLERGWCRGVCARNEQGWAVKPSSDHAVAWCAYGALAAAGMSPNGPHYYPAVRQLMIAAGCHSLPYFNDAQETVEPVLAAFDRAIAAGG
jgi:hypothetical protein